MKMTKAMYHIKPTYKEMIETHKKEIQNHQNLIDEFIKRSEKTKSYEERIICLLEAHRNREHQKGHEVMIRFYTYLLSTNDIY